MLTYCMFTKKGLKVYQGTHNRPFYCSQEMVWKVLEMKAKAPSTLRRRKTELYFYGWAYPEKLSTENGAFWKRSANLRNLKTPAPRFSVDGKHFGNGAFRKQWRHDNHVINPNPAAGLFCVSKFLLVWMEIFDASSESKRRFQIFLA